MREQPNDEAAAFRTAAAGMRKTAEEMTQLAALLERIADAEERGDTRARLAAAFP